MFKTKAMQRILKERLQAYIIEHNPELVSGLRADLAMTQYLEDRVRSVMPLVLDLISEDQPGHVIEELALEQMTASLRPSKFDYLKTLLAEDFPEDHQRFKRHGVLTFETLNLLEHCYHIFEGFGFSQEHQHNPLLRHSIIARIQGYLL